MERKPLSRVTVCGNRSPPFPSLGRAGTWGKDPEAKSLRNEKEQTPLHCQSFGFLASLFTLNLQEFDVKPSLNPKGRMEKKGAQVGL